MKRDFRPDKVDKLYNPQKKKRKKPPGLEKAFTNGTREPIRHHLYYFILLPFFQDVKLF